MDEEQNFQQRPDGSTATIVGWILVAVGIIVSFFSGGDDPGIVTLAFLIASLCFSLGILLISLGYLVKAIWFLPGRDIPVADRAVTPADGECEWCGAAVASPGLPCSAVPFGKFEAGFKVSNEICQQKLKERLVALDRQD